MTYENIQELSIASTAERDLRKAILPLLEIKPRRTLLLAQELEVWQTSVANALKKMKQEGLVVCFRVGRQNYWALKEKFSNR